MLLLLFLLLQLAEHAQGGQKWFQGQVVHGNGENDYKNGWIVKVECKSGCLKRENDPRLFTGEVKTAGSRFKVDLTRLMDSRNRTGIDLLVTVKSIARLGGKLRKNSWLIEKADLEKLHTFQLGHFAPGKKGGMHLSFKFTKGLPATEKATLKPEKDRPNGPVELQKYVVTVKDRNFRQLMDKSQILEEEEWTGKKEFQLKVGTHENNFVDYLRNNEKPSILLAVHLIPNDETVKCGICEGVHKEGGMLRKLPNCDHFFHDECLNKLAMKGKKELQRRLSSGRSGRFGGIIPSCLAGSPISRRVTAPTTAHHEEPEAAAGSSTAPQHSGDQPEMVVGKGDRQHICPVVGCSEKFLEKNKKGLAFGKEVNYHPDFQLIEKEVFKFNLPMPIFQNGENPEYTYEFDPLRKLTRLEKIGGIFWIPELQGGWREEPMSADNVPDVTELKAVEAKQIIMSSCRFLQPRKLACPHAVFRSNSAQNIRLILRQGGEGRGTSLPAAPVHVAPVPVAPVPAAPVHVAPVPVAPVPVDPVPVAPVHVAPVPVAPVPAAAATIPRELELHELDLPKSDKAPEEIKDLLKNKKKPEGSAQVAAAENVRKNRHHKQPRSPRIGEGAGESSTTHSTKGKSVVIASSIGGVDAGSSSLGPGIENQVDPKGKGKKVNFNLGNVTQAAADGTEESHKETSVVEPPGNQRNYHHADGAGKRAKVPEPSIIPEMKTSIRRRRLIGEHDEAEDEEMPDAEEAVKAADKVGEKIDIGKKPEKAAHQLQDRQQQKQQQQVQQPIPVEAAEKQMEIDNDDSEYLSAESVIETDSNQGQNNESVVHQAAVDVNALDSVGNELQKREEYGSSNGFWDFLADYRHKEDTQKDPKEEPPAKEEDLLETFHNIVHF